MGTLYLRGGGKKKKPDLAPDYRDEASGFEIVIDKRHKYAGAQSLISMNSKLGRIVLYSETYRATVEKYGKDFEFVRLLRKSQKHPTKFWIQPCTRTDIGSRSIHIAAGSRIISAKLLLQKVGFESNKAVHFKALWDQDAKALVVDISQPTEQ